MPWPELVLKHRQTLIAVLLALVVLGIQARFQIPVQLFPDTDPPTVTVITEYPGMASIDVDADLTKILEEELTSLDGVIRISSTSQAGLSVVRVEFQYGISSSLAAVDVQSAVGRVRRDLPAGIGEPRILEFSTSDKPIITLAMSGYQVPLDQVRMTADNEVRQRLERVPGVAAIDVFGGHKSELHVAVLPHKLDAVNVTMDRVNQVLREWNLSTPGGRVLQGDMESVVRFDAPISSPEDAKQLVIKADGPNRVRLGDVARVSLEPGEQRSAYSFNNEPAIAVQVIKRTEANTVEVAGLVREAVEELKNDFSDLKIILADDDSDFTRLVISDMTRTVIIAIILTVFIVFLFLANFRQAFIIALSIPASFLTTFALMQAAGLDMNMVTMSALILSIGLLVDDGIVILENMHRHISELGKTPFEAATQGVSEVLRASLGGTLTTLGVLIPLMFLGGFIGKMFGPLSMTIAFALCSSFFMSITLIPLLGAYLLRPGDVGKKTSRFKTFFDRGLNGFKQYYLAGLLTSLKRPKATVFTALLLLLAGIGMLRLVGSEMLPRFDSGNFRVLVDMAPGMPLEKTTSATGSAEALLMSKDYTLAAGTLAGHEAGARSMGGRGAMGVNQAEITVNLIPRTQRDKSQWDIMDEVRVHLEKIPGVVLSVPREMGGTARSGTTAPITVRVSGEEPAELDRIAENLLEHLQNIPGITDLYKNWGLDTPEIQVHVDHERASELDLTGTRIAAAVHQAMDGHTITRFRQGTRRDLDVVVRYAQSERAFLEDFENISLNSPFGRVPLREIVDLEFRLGPRIMTRENSRRTLEIHGYHLGRPLSEVVAEVRARLEKFESQPGYQVTLVGEQEDFAEARSRMMRALMLSAMAVYLILVVQFGSFKHPLTIMSAIPLQFIGVGAALLLAGKHVSMPALLGIILLIGIVVNNAIILLDLARSRIQSGQSPDQAVLEAVDIRFRPIMMTGLSTIAGMTPLALEMAVGSERFSPIATVIIGGVITATVLTLIVVPALFAAMEKPKA
jgi:hydrophobe/amphiphile efflux-1 (HAE1) family protein